MNTSTVNPDHRRETGVTLGHQAVLTPQQQAQAVRELQAHAQRRLQLGMQLFDHAQKQTQTHQAMADQLRLEQAQLRQLIQEDISRSLHTYDQWIGQVETDFTARLDQLDRRMDELQRQWQEMAAQVQNMMSRAETLLDQARMIGEAAVKLSQQPAISAPVSVVGTIKPARPQTHASSPPPTNIQPSMNSVAENLPAPMTEPPAVPAPPAVEPIVRYLKLLELLQQNPPKQNAA